MPRPDDNHGLEPRGTRPADTRPISSPRMPSGPLTIPVERMRTRSIFILGTEITARMRSARLKRSPFELAWCVRSARRRGGRYRPADFAVACFRHVTRIISRDHSSARTAWRSPFDHHAIANRPTAAWSRRDRHVLRSHASSDLPGLGPAAPSPAAARCALDQRESGRRRRQRQRFAKKINRIGWPSLLDQRARVMRAACAPASVAVLSAQRPHKACSRRRFAEQRLLGA